MNNRNQEDFFRIIVNIRVSEVREIRLIDVERLLYFAYENGVQSEFIEWLKNHRDLPDGISDAIDARLAELDDLRN